MLSGACGSSSTELHAASSSRIRAWDVFPEMAAVTRAAVLLSARRDLIELQLADYVSARPDVGMLAVKRDRPAEIAVAGTACLRGPELDALFFFGRSAKREVVVANLLRCNG